MIILKDSNSDQSIVNTTHPHPDAMCYYCHRIRQVRLLERNLEDNKNSLHLLFNNYYLYAIGNFYQFSAFGINITF